MSEISIVLVRFFSSAPTLEQIVAFELDAELQTRAVDLLARHRNGVMTPEAGGACRIRRIYAHGTLYESGEGGSTIEYI